MGIWLTALLAGLLGVGWAMKRRSMARKIEAGDVSESWLREQRAEKRHDPFS
jgi:hypothetical protein